MSKRPPISDHSMSKTTVKVVVFHCRLAPSSSARRGVARTDQARMPRFPASLALASSAPATRAPCVLPLLRQRFGAMRLASWRGGAAAVCGARLPPMLHPTCRCTVSN